MILKTYRLKAENYPSKINFLKALNQGPLKNDKLWHFFLDPEGGTVRFQKESESAVRKFVKKEAKEYGVELKRRKQYDPEKHEYFGVSFLGEDILPLFHEMSILALTYPPYVMLRPVLERLNHGLINMVGVHDFVEEANLYLRLAESRVRMVGGLLPYPKWILLGIGKIKRLFKGGD